MFSFKKLWYHIYWDVVIKIRSFFLYSMYKAFIAKPFSEYLKEADKDLERVKSMGLESKYNRENLASLNRWLDYLRTKKINIFCGIKNDSASKEK